MKTHRPVEGTRDAVYQVRLPVSKRTIEPVAGLIRGRRKQLGTRWRKVTPGTQAIIVLAVLRHDQPLLDMAGGNDVSASTVRRWVLEVLGLLAYLIWISSVRHGRASEITAARHDHITRRLREAGLGALADLGFVGLDDDPDDAPVIITGRKATRSHRLTDAEKEANRLVSRERAAVERGFANLKSWRILTEVRMNAHHATTLLRALLVLANREVRR